MQVIMILALVNLPLIVNAQKDTLYVFFQQKGGNNVLHGERKHKDDPDPRNYYPFDGGRLYIIPKQVGKYKNSLSFSFKSYTPEWMDHQFYHEIVDENILEEKDFKDRTWFDKTEYREIIRTFDGRDKVIYLVDEGYIKDGKAYMVRVYFGYPAVE